MTSYSRKIIGTVILGAIAIGGIAGYASAQSMSKLILVDGAGLPVGELSTKAPVVDPVTGKGKVEVKTRGTSAPRMTMSPLAPAPTATPVLVTVEVPSSLPVGFCVSGDYYNRSTGLCADGKLPYKIVPVNSLSNPASQTPTLACAAPMVATFSPATSKWSCIVPPGFKLSM